MAQSALTCEILRDGSKDLIFLTQHFPLRVNGIKETVDSFTSGTLKSVAEESVGQGLFEHRGADLEWLMDKFILDLSRGARAGGRRVVNEPVQSGVVSCRMPLRARYSIFVHARHPEWWC